MAQFYSRVFSFPAALKTILKYRFARTLFGNGWVGSIPLSAFLIPVILVSGISFCSAQGKEQTGSIKSLSGNWVIQSAEVMENNQKVKTITKENCRWADHVNLQTPLIITSDGSVTYSMDEKPANASVKIESDNLIFYFPQNGKVVKYSDKGDIGSGGDNFTSTAYQYSVQGRQLVLTRQDPEFSEKYIFKRQ